MANQIVISRIQNRRGIRENLPQPLLPGEFALTIDTGELWIGTDPNQPPFGVRTYSSGSGDIAAAEAIADGQVVSAKFSPDLDQAGFDSLVLYLTGTPTPAVVLTNQDILWDDRATVFISADTSIDILNTVLDVYEAVENSGVGTLTISFADAFAANFYVSLGAINDPSINPATTDAFDPVDGDFLFVITGSDAEQGAMAARLINQIHGTQLVTTLANLQVTTSGIGVGTPTFRDWEIFDTEASLPFVPIWSPVGTNSADSVTDKMYVLSGDGMNIDVDPANDAIRFTNTFVADATDQFTLTTDTTSFTDVPGLLFTATSEDVIILEYSLNIDGAVAGADNYTVIGTMMIVGNALVGSGTATLNDTQAEVRDTALVGDVNFQAVWSAGDIQIQYTNTFGVAVTDVNLRVLRRRWSSF